jgi:hypothetical protein
MHGSEFQPQCAAVYAPPCSTVQRTVPAISQWPEVTIIHPTQRLQEGNVVTYISTTHLDADLVHWQLFATCKQTATNVNRSRNKQCQMLL